MGYAMMVLIMLAFLFVIFTFAFVLHHFLSRSLPGKDALVIDTPEEALERKL
ncbi:hypothetical protein J4760_13070 [Salinicoccus sp. ID82-1]|uniref:hypothetical protein n=1 Tax=Salinicoccus TaxID=45669 RepID=UPI001643BEEE|nr:MULTISPECIES: hypothetical protein [Salinicoccus]MCG1010952.1 hypothetical protein [Salinicoccus sp. ID82-1]